MPIMKGKNSTTDTKETENVLKIIIFFIKEFQKKLFKIKLKKSDVI